MGRQKDITPHRCKECGEELTAAGMPSHLYRKHNGLSSVEYVKKYGEFRKKFLFEKHRKSTAGIKCKECEEDLISHKQLIHHINREHSGWESYFIKHFFNGKHPTCGCGCQGQVKLLRQGRDEKGNNVYARSFITGHDTKTRITGYRVNTPNQRQTMRKAAIKRMKEKEGTFFNNGPSKQEVELKLFLESLGQNVQVGDREVLSGLEIDLYLPELNIGIEYNGGYFHSDIFKKRKYHLGKTLECSSGGIRLIHIWESDWYTQPEKIKSLLRNITNNTPQRIYARDTEIREINYQQAKRFLEDNHLQGNSVSKVRLGLFHKDQLVSVMTFSGLRTATGRRESDGSFELVRFCNKMNTVVVGGGTKLFKHFTIHWKPNYILSYANRDWSIGNLYEKLNMKLHGYTQPGYFYTKARYRFSRFQFQKHKLVQQGADPTLTEYEIMLQRGYYRVWDTGNLIYEWKSL